MEWLIPLGVLAGLITTIAGMGGGLMLLLALGALWNPIDALACTAPALLVGNVHRLFLFRRQVDWPALRGFALGAVPGAIAGGYAVALVPESLVRWLMVAMTLLVVVKAAGWIRFSVGRYAVLPGGLVIGGLTGASGGAGLLVAPLLLTRGIVGDAFVATTAGCAVAMHAGRIVGYGASGLFTAELLGLAGVAAVAISAGNTLGRAARRHAKLLPEGLLEVGTLVVCVTLALWGAA